MREDMWLFSARVLRLHMVDAGFVLDIMIVPAECTHELIGSSKNGDYSAIASVHGPIMPNIVAFPLRAVFNLLRENLRSSRNC